MKAIGIIGIMAAGMACANPETITTNILKSDYDRAMLGGADDKTFSQDFLGCQLGTIIKSFTVTCGHVTCAVTANTDFHAGPTFKYNPPSDPGNPPGGPNDPPPPPNNPPNDPPTGPNNPTVPEIDPGTGMTALSLLAGAVLMIRGRKKA